VLGVGILVTFSMMQAGAEHDPSADPRVRSFIEGVLAAVVLVSFAYVAVRAWATSPTEPKAASELRSSSSARR
jgi:hypothetical protein